MKLIGAHVSSSGGVENAPLNAAAIGANAFALFTKNQRQWVSAPLSEQSIRLFKENCIQHGFIPDSILPHDSYLINLGHPQSEGLGNQGLHFLTRCSVANNWTQPSQFHPGAISTKFPCEVPETRCRIHKHGSGQDFRWNAVIENTAGQGSNVGFQFEHLAENHLAGRRQIESWGLHRYLPLLLPAMMCVAERTTVTYSTMEKTLLAK